VGNEVATGVDSCPSGAKPKVAASVLHAAAVHPRAQRIAWGISAVVVVALVGASFGTTELPAERASPALPKPLLTPEMAVVSRVLSKDGDRVVAGQVLVELTALRAGANAREQLGAAALQERLAATLIAALESGKAPVLSRESPAQERAQFQAEWRDITVQLAQFDATLAKQQTELAAIQQAITRIEALLPPVDERARDFERLVDDNTAAPDLKRVRVQERIRQERELSGAQASLKSAQAALAQCQAERAQFVERTLRSLRERQALAAERRAQLARGLGKPENPGRLIQLMAPVTGTVQQQAVPPEGDLASPGQVLLFVAPGIDDAELMSASEP
jgi:hemolysin D